MRDVTLALQASSGVNGAMFVWIGIAVFAALTAFAFLCLAGYDWLSTLFGTIYAALIMAGGFMVVALIGVAAVAISRSRTKARAEAERAARAQAASSMLLDPQLLNLAMQAGRSLGWQRVAPVALLGVIGFAAAQWFQSRRNRAAYRADAG